MYTTNTLLDRLKPFMPFLLWWPMVNRRTLRDDLIAGLTGAVVVLPQGVAFATIAGMPPEYGLYAGMVPAIVAALFGSSWHLVSGPTTAASIVLYSILSTHAEPGSAQYVQLAFTLTFMVGLMQLALGAARLGSLVNFISHSVVIGFTAGAALLIATKQAKNFFGLAIPRGTSFADTWGTLFTHLDQIGPYVTSVALFTLLLGVTVRRFLPRWPYMIVAMLGGSLLGIAFQQIGVTTITTVGALPSSLPPLSMPTFSPETWQDLVGGAVAVTLLALTEAVSIARAMAVRSGQDLNGNQEFMGQGLSNVVGSFFSGYVATGSFNRSGLNYTAGAKTAAQATLRKGGFLEVIGEDNSYRCKSEAIAKVFNKLDPQVCSNCRRLVFNECGSVPGTAVVPLLSPSTRPDLIDTSNLTPGQPLNA